MRLICALLIICQVAVRASAVELSADEVDAIAEIKSQGDYVEVFVDEKNGQREFRVSLFETSDQAMMPIPRLRPCTEIVISRSRVTDAGIEPIKHLHDLRSIHIEDTPITDAGIEYLRDLRPAFLGLTNTRITGKGLKVIGSLGTVEHLILDRCSIETGSYGPLSRLKKLEQLHLFQTPVLDDDLVHLVKLDKLHTLILGDTKITDLGLKQIARIKNLSHLYLVDTKVTERGVEALRAKRPDLLVIY